VTARGQQAPGVNRAPGVPAQKPLGEIPPAVFYFHRPVAVLAILPKDQPNITHPPKLPPTDAMSATRFNGGVFHARPCPGGRTGGLPHQTRTPQGTVLTFFRYSSPRQTGCISHNPAREQTPTKCLFGKP
jgi:hypothetical protein